MYVSALDYNGAPSDRPWVPASLIRDGGSLSYALSSTPASFLVFEWPLLPGAAPAIAS